MDDTNKVVLNFYNSLLRNDDVHLLTGPHWLNDQIISFYLEYLENVVHKDKKNILYVSPEVVQCLKFASKEEMSIFLEPLNAKEKSFILLPLNDNNEVWAGGNHWSLLAFSRPECTFYYYDSMNGDSLKSLVPFVRKIAQAIGCPEFDYIKGHSVRQSNSYDCGIHVLCTIDRLSERALQFDALDDRDDDEDDRRELDRKMIENIRNKRNDLLKIIRKLGGDVRFWSQFMESIELNDCWQAESHTFVLHSTFSCIYLFID